MTNLASHVELFDKMIRSKKILIYAALTLIVLIAGLWGGQYFLYALGEREIYLAAQENGYCEDEACHEGKVMLAAMLMRETGIDAGLISWCMAANLIHTSQFGAFDGLKEKFSGWMYQSCGNDEITIEDGVFSVGEP